MILDEIIDHKKRQLETEMKSISIDGWKQKMRGPGLHKPLDFQGAIQRKGELSIIGEVKKASPSKGLIREAFNPAEIAGEYVQSGVQAISVLTERKFFLGSEEYLVDVRQCSPLPVLRKDFLIDVWQVYQSRQLGADAILLIVAALTPEMLRKMMVVAGILGLHCLVEVHDEAELEVALDAGAKILGINNRNLKTFEVDLGVTGRLIGRIPPGRAVVSESGIVTAADMKLLKELGVDAVLIGETLMRASSISGKLEELRRS